MAQVPEPQIVKMPQEILDYLLQLEGGDISKITGMPTITLPETRGNRTAMGLQCMQEEAWRKFHG